MASMTDIKQRVMLAIPVEKRAEEERGVELGILSAIEELSSIHRWNFRETYTDISLTANTSTYNMPTDCDMISGADGVLVDANENPTKNRLIMMTEFQFNQDYISRHGDDTTEDTATPEYYIPLIGLSSEGSIRVRFYPAPDTTYTARMYFYRKPTSNDMNRLIGSLVEHKVLSCFARYLGDNGAHQQFMFYKTLLAELKPQDRKAVSSVPLVTQGRRWINHNISLRDRQGQK